MVRAQAVIRVLSLCFAFQPRKIEEIKDFLLTARRKDAKCEWLLGGGAGRVVPPEPGVLLGVEVPRGSRCRGLAGCVVSDDWSSLR